MLDKVAFNNSFDFYKGNLHCHSTVSDGHLNYEEIKHKYKSNGYNFLCYSDHNVFNDMTSYDDKDFITLPGVEWDCDCVENGEVFKTHHISGFRGTKEMLSRAKEEPLKHGEKMPRLVFKGQETVQEMMQYFKDRGNFCTYNHPLWSCMTPADFGSLEGYAAMEIYNNACNLSSHTSHGDVYWDMLLCAGHRICGVAADDNHNIKTEFPDDSCGGWINVNAPELTHDEVVSAIIEGRFYSSTGPVIKNYGVLDGMVFVECSPVNHINIIAGGGIMLGACYWSENIMDNSLTYAEKKLTGKERYIRIECVDHLGRTAWSNPLYPD